jgi:tRNA threonylcarbamoyl adenosine modification protein YeaZ/ribosomal-protein-alanine acetyltransferase
VSGVAIECATGRADVLVRDGSGNPQAQETEEVGQGHALRLTSLLSRALSRAGVCARELAWVAADLGPGSFTGVRVGLATAHALALAGRARVVGASSLAALAHAAPHRRALIVPMVPAGRSECYVGFFRSDSRRVVRLVAAPQVHALDGAVDAIGQARLAAESPVVRCVGPGAGRWRADLEDAFPGCTEKGWRFDGLSASDLADAALSTAGPAAGLPTRGEQPQPLYVRSAQAEERVRHRVAAADPVRLRPMEPRDVPGIARIEREVFTDPWPESFFLGELAQPQVYARVADRDGRVVGYSVAWLGGDGGHLGNLAVPATERRRGVATVLLEDLFEEAQRRGVESLALEVRVSNYPAQGLYRAHGFRLAGLRRGYYRDTGEDALVMQWRRGSGS